MDDRWTQLRAWLAKSEIECDGAASIASRSDGPSSVAAVRFRAEAQGYQETLKMMDSLEDQQ